MSEIKQKVIEMLQLPQLSSMATITLDGKPWTRYIMIQSDNDFNIRSAVCLDSRKIKQIEKNPEVHLTFGINDPQDLNKPYIQIQGTAKITTDQQEKNNYWFEMLSAIFKGPEDPSYAIMIIEPYRVEFNNPGTMIPEVWEK
ncbi:MAG: pyridoxamine 5'-phosphate oxidase family protein [PVC group bacterium]|nr:pyridoxamine 5'-phosphate oxidase family protein [PVC group bacterium]